MTEIIILPPRATYAECFPERHARIVDDAALHATIDREIDADQGLVDITSDDLYGWAHAAADEYDFTAEEIRIFVTAYVKAYFD